MIFAAVQVELQVNAEELYYPWGPRIRVRGFVPRFQIEKSSLFSWIVQILRQTLAPEVVCFFEYSEIFNVTLNEEYDVTKHENDLKNDLRKVNDYFSLLQTNKKGELALVLKKSLKDWTKSNYWLQVTVTRDQVMFLFKEIHKNKYCLKPHVY